MKNNKLVCLLLKTLWVGLFCVVSCVHASNDWTFTNTNELGINAVKENNLFWRLSDQFSPQSQFDTSTQWLEIYVEPGVAGEYISGSSRFYGELSLVGSGTLGTDAFARGDTGRLTIEDAYVGFLKRWSNSSLDISLGAQEFSTGTGMLLSSGGSSGFERGALKLGPRKAWKNTVVAEYELEKFKFTSFFLSPNDLDSNITNTDIVGADFRFEPAGHIQNAGLTIGKVIDSSSPYPVAGKDGLEAPGIIDGGRNGLEFVYGYAKATKEDAAQRTWSADIDIAKETHESVDMAADAARIKLGLSWTKTPWQPSITYSYQQFSGDDPATSRLERFDPLYYEGSPNAWSSGSKSSMMFINSNLRVHQLAFRWMPKVKHILTFRMARISADELRSPIQFGQATRLDLADGLSAVVSGVTERHLSNDYFIEYNYLINKKNYFNAGIAIAQPGAGIKNLLNEKNYWTGGYVNFVTLL